MPASMNKTGLILSLAALASATPLAKRQFLNLAAIVDQNPAPTVTVATAPTIIAVNPTSLASDAAAAITAAPVTVDAADILTSVANVRRGAISTTITTSSSTSNACATRPAQPSGYGPVPTPDTASAFLADPYYPSVASAAATPSGYTQAFTALNAENNAYGYLGYMTMTSYDPQSCANQCNTIYGCQAINIAFERDPSVDPDYTDCTNPSSTTNIKCVFWGSPVTTGNANNAGQWRANFQVVIAGSNGYNTHQNLPSVPGYDSTYLGNSSINAPPDCNGIDPYMGFTTFNDGAPFSEERCAAACSAQSVYNIAHPPSDGSAPRTCQFYNTYFLLENGQVQNQVCVMYTESWEPAYGTNTGYSSGGNNYTIMSSVAASNITNPNYPPAGC